MNQMNQDLVGATIHDAFVAKNNENDPLIYLTTDKGVFLIGSGGDCCEATYMQHVAGSEALKGAVVYKVERLELPNHVESQEDKERYNTVVDSTFFWGGRIHTTKGICTIEMRTTTDSCYSGILDIGKINTLPVEITTELEDF